MDYFTQWNEEEFKLAQHMKEHCCDTSGKETDPAKAAEIIHKLAVIYRKRSPDKIALIQSVGLFNAAIVRNPSNIARVKSDLNEICQHILQNAEAKNQSVCLVKKAKQVKAQAEKMRIEVETHLENSLPNIPANNKTNDAERLISQKISEIRKINKTIANKYKQIMVDVSQFCENVMGKPPCEYAVVGMGSLARDEITPYSDFEHIILLHDNKNYKHHLEYYRWFSVIFHVIILNLQETIIPSLLVDSLNVKEHELSNWYYDAITPRGISFDGLMPHACKFPLGRTQHTQNKPFTTELIKPVNEMLEYLSSEANLRNGYHLADILTKTCFVCGNKYIFEKFSLGVQINLNKISEPDILSNVQQQVKDDLAKFSARFQLAKLKSRNKINIKQTVYRSTTIFISALATLHKISANSSFDIIDKLEQHNKISQNTANKLRYAIAIATEMRLKFYMNSKCQNDDVIINLNEGSGMEKFLNIVGTVSTISYFQIAYCLQCEMAKQLNFTKLYFYSDPKLINSTIGLAFGLKTFPSFSKKSHHPMWHSHEFDFDTCIFELETEICKKFISTKTTAFSLNEFIVNAMNINNIAKELYLANLHDEALEFFEQALKIYQEITLDANKDGNIAEVVSNLGLCHLELCNYSNALTYLNFALEIFQNITLKSGENSNIAAILQNIGFCYKRLHNYSDAMTILNLALQIYQNITLNADEDRNIAETFYKIGLCYKSLRNTSDALTFLNRALEINHKITLTADEDNEIADTLHSIGLCHIQSCNYSEALAILNRVLEIRQNTMGNVDEGRKILLTFYNVGLCHMYLCNYCDSLIFLHRALKIKENIMLNPDKDREIAELLFGTGLCHMNLCNYSDALEFLNRALKIYENITLNADEDNHIAKIMNNIGFCHMHLFNYSNALIFLKCALKIKENITPNADKDYNIALTLNNIGMCQMNLRNYFDALTFLNRALDINQNIALNADEDTTIAMTLLNIALCYKRIRNDSDALTFFNRALVINQNVTQNFNQDSNIAEMLHDIGFYHMVQRNYCDALTFLNRAHEIYQNTTCNGDEDSSIAQILNSIGVCHMVLDNYSDALTFLNRALEIKQNLTFNGDRDSNFAKMLNNIGSCHMYLCNYSDALTFLCRALEINLHITLNANIDFNIATTSNNIGFCLVHLHNYSNALTMLNRALKTYKNITLNADKDRNIATTLNNIGLCHKGLRNYSDALIFFNRALEIYRNLTLNTVENSNIVMILDDIEYCNKRLLNFSNAFKVIFAVAVAIFVFYFVFSLV